MTLQGGFAGGTIIAEIGGEEIVFESERPVFHFQTPHGAPLAAAGTDAAARTRYTDHEHDALASVNYMRGRTQYPSLAGNFGRPDPARITFQILRTFR